MELHIFIICSPHWVKNVVKVQLPLELKPWPHTLQWPMPCIVTSLYWITFLIVLLPIYLHIHSLLNNATRFYPFDVRKVSNRLQPLKIQHGESWMFKDFSNRCKSWFLLFCLKEQVSKAMLLHNTLLWCYNWHFQPPKWEQRCTNNICCVIFMSTPQPFILVSALCQKKSTS